MPQIISRREARAAGLRRYFTGVPCKHGHICERTISGVCVDCQYISNRKDPEKNRERQRQVQVARLAVPEQYQVYRDRINAQRRKVYADNPEKWRAKTRKWNAGHPGEIKARRKDYRERNINSLRESSWKNAGIHSAIWVANFLKWPEFIGKLYEQQGVCWGCGVLLNAYDKKCCADHCHTTGIFRHVLCHHCNRIEGYSHSPLIDLFREDTRAFEELYSW
jgi:hypothetical protein